MTTTLSSRQFNRNIGGAKQAAKTGPVFMTEHGEPAYVFLSMEDDRSLTRQERAATTFQPDMPQKTIIDLLGMPGMEELADIDIDFPERKGDWGLRIPDFD